ncbi:alpha/beta fold hydrolase [Promicromonospora thailandica]|uniref:Pimeloyl-ACP methyl ester carboxylesterase n=1 Tax=Promicromonospora thailandica TaxID=765201 RepID=A0A9X2JXN8_9MICO|nr:alpha/beta hydrolase [Promicromonospora thailandica]MCP2266418.1 Pimeloyl-ACP methyl ester carboxylesterase [Promicromonospora thailandica]
MTALSARPAVRTAATTDYTCALVDGPWQHEFVSSGGSRFHVVVAGPEHRSAPLVVLLHGYPQFWWAWRAQIPALADAGYRVAAMDVRGAGGSDKPPSGYGVPARAADVAGVVRSLGRERAVVVGHGTGGTLAWAVAALHPGTTSAVAVLSSPHPARVRLGGRAAFTPAALRELAYLQMPTLPERALTQGDLVARTLALGAAAPFPDDAVELYRSAMRIPFAAHSAAEALRWAVRSTPRMDGRRFGAALRRPIDVPALQLQGGRDGFVRADRADLDAVVVARDLRYELIPDAGHFLPEEAPDRVSTILLDWLARVSPVPR